MLFDFVMQFIQYVEKTPGFSNSVLITEFYYSLSVRNAIPRIFVHIKRTKHLENITAHISFA